MRRRFLAKDVLSVYTGRLLGKFEGLHKLMDHFYPGIMTIGVAAMSKRASEELARQLPILKTLPEHSEPWQTWLTAMLKMLPETFDVEGPVNTSDAIIDEAFSEFMAGARK